ncbi:MAG: hypothetical protein ACLFVA_02750 [Dehalococcoidia bacterium]
MGRMYERPVYYFEEPGAENTGWVIEAVSRRLEGGEVSKVIIASTSGNTAVEFARSLRGRAELTCVSEAPYRREWGEEWPCLKEEFRQELERLGVTIIDRVPYVFHSSILESAKDSGAFPERVVRETLYSFGQGMKVAVEVALTAVSCGYVTPYEDVIGVGGSGKGADTAIVLRATYPASLFDKDPVKRLEIREVIAMPICKKWWE